MSMRLAGKIVYMRAEKTKDGKRTFYRLQIFTNGGRGPAELNYVTDMSGVSRVYGADVDLAVAVQAYVGKNGVPGLSYTHWGNEEGGKSDGMVSGVAESAAASPVAGDSGGKRAAPYGGK